MSLGRFRASQENANNSRTERVRGLGLAWINREQFFLSDGYIRSSISTKSLSDLLFTNFLVYLSPGWSASDQSDFSTLFTQNLISYRVVKTAGFYLIPIKSYSRNSHTHGIFGQMIVCLTEHHSPMNISRIQTWH